MSIVKVKTIFQKPKKKAIPEKFASNTNLAPSRRISAVVKIEGLQNGSQRIHPMVQDWKKHEIMVD